MDLNQKSSLLRKRLDEPQGRTPCKRVRFSSPPAPELISLSSESSSEDELHIDLTTIYEMDSNASDGDEKKIMTTLKPLTTIFDSSSDVFDEEDKPSIVKKVDVGTQTETQAQAPRKSKISVFARLGQADITFTEDTGDKRTVWDRLGNRNRQCNRQCLGCQYP
jgi:hypothetical protein